MQSNNVGGRVPGVRKKVPNPSTTAPTDAARRRDGGWVSVSVVAASTNSATPHDPRVRKIARQPHAVSRSPPAIGANIGAVARTAVIVARTRADAAASWVSRTIARPTTAPTEAPTPWRNRIPTSTPIVGANPHTTPATANPASPTSRTRRRPKASDSGPTPSWPSA